MSNRQSAPKNPVIAQTFYKRKLVEIWGRGLSLIINECVKAGLREPKIFVEGASFYVIMFLEKETPQEAPQEAPQEILNRIPDKVKKLILVISFSSLSLRSIMENMELSDRKSFLDIYLAPAMEMGYVQMLYPDNPKHRNQKYFLSNQGVKILKLL